MGEFDKVWTPVSCFALAALCYWLSWDVMAALLLLTAVPMTAGVVLLTARDKWRQSLAAKAEHERQRRLMRDARNQAVHDLVERALRSLESLPVQLADAERHLRTAEQDFQDRAFAPFWDAIEATAGSLGRFTENVEFITVGCTDYKQLVRDYEGMPPRFPIRTDSVLPIREARNTSERIGQLVRLAQRDYQFATIFEQRKTNSILMHGFSSLRDAIEQMTERLEAALSSLDTSVNQMNSDVSQALRGLSSGATATESLAELKRIRKRL